MALPPGHKADQVCETHTRHIVGLPDQAVHTLTSSQGPEMPRHQRLSHSTGMEVFSPTPTAPRGKKPTKTPTDSLLQLIDTDDRCCISSNQHERTPYYEAGLYGM